MVPIPVGHAPSSRLHPPKFSGDWPMGSRIQLQQRNCSRFSRDFSRRSTNSSSQRTGLRSSGLRFRPQDLFIRPRNSAFLAVSPDSPSTSRHRRRRLHRLEPRPRPAGQIPEARLTVIDDFRSGDFKNLRRLPRRFRRRRIWPRSIGGSNSATKNSTRFFISLRSPTRPCTISSCRCTTTWKVFAASLILRGRTETRIVYASSAATYGAGD